MCVTCNSPLSHGLHHPLLPLPEHVLLLLLVRGRLGEADLHLGAAPLLAVQGPHGLHRLLPLLEVDEGVVLDLLHPVHLSIPDV